MHLNADAVSKWAFVAKWGQSGSPGKVKQQVFQSPRLNVLYIPFSEEPPI
jgi:hypothetical protein